MTRVKQIVPAALLALCLVQVSYGGTITGGKTNATGARAGTITGSRTGLISGSRVGTISGSRTSPVSEHVTDTGLGNARTDLLVQLMTMFMNWAW